MRIRFKLSSLSMMLFVSWDNPGISEHTHTSNCDDEDGAGDSFLVALALLLLEGEIDLVDGDRDLAGEALLDGLVFAGDFAYTRGEQNNSLAVIYLGCRRRPFR